MQVDVLLERPGSEPRAQDRVRRNTPARFNQRIDEAMMKRVWEYSRRTPEQISEGIKELDAEWDIERVLETGAGSLAFSGVLLSGFRSRRWLVLSATFLGLLLQHSLTRKGALGKVLRAAGFRTRREIDAEKYALRMLRGDFEPLKSAAEESHRAIEALRLSRP
jgi:hypothetical protein